jgi:hypothetical protein
LIAAQIIFLRGDFLVFAGGFAKTRVQKRGVLRGEWCRIVVKTWWKAPWLSSAKNMPLL